MCIFNINNDIYNINLKVNDSRTSSESSSESELLETMDRGNNNFVSETLNEFKEYVRVLVDKFYATMDFLKQELEEKNFLIRTLTLRTANEGNFMMPDVNANDSRPSAELPDSGSVNCKDQECESRSKVGDESSQEDKPADAFVQLRHVREVAHSQYMEMKRNSTDSDNEDEISPYFKHLISTTEGASMTIPTEKPNYDNISYVSFDEEAVDKLKLPMSLKNLAGYENKSVTSRVTDVPLAPPFPPIFSEPLESSETFLPPSTAAKPAFSDIFRNENEDWKNAESRRKHRTFRSTVIIGDSMIRDIKGKKLSSKLDKQKIYVKPHGGAKVGDLKHHAIPYLDYEPDHVIIHAGTNEIRTKKKFRRK